jgi:DNA-binding response OmpR family regulator
MFNNVKPAVLIVDDDEDMLHIIDYSLSADGFDVKVSHNGDNVWDIITRSRPDIILLDIQMDGVDGSTICQKLKENKNTSGIPVIMFSANDNVQFISKSCGANGFIEKPFELKKMKIKINDLLVKNQSFTY